MSKGPQEGVCSVCLKNSEEANVSRARVIKGVRKAMEGLRKNFKDFGFSSEATISGQFPKMGKPLDGFEQRRHDLSDLYFDEITLTAM